MNQSDAECEASGFRRCPCCATTKPLADFYKKARPTGKYGKCKECTRERAKEWITANLARKQASQHRYYTANAEKARAYATKWKHANPEKRKNSYLLRRFGITLVQYNELLTKQNNACPGCLRPFTKDLFPVVDHCHKTGAVRGILCSFCNRAVGLAQDNPDTLRAMASYIRKHQ